MKSIIILGRQPSLGLAEIESLYGPEVIEKYLNNMVILNIDYANIDFARLGGSIKLANIITEFEGVNWSEIVNRMPSIILKDIQNLHEGKLKLGLSVYGFEIKLNQIHQAAMNLKNTLKNAGQSVRIIPNSSPYLNSAQIIHNKLTDEMGREIIIAKLNNRTIIGRTINEQDISGYAARDQARPKRDSRVGMLPPKLAQIILNIAVGQNKIRTVLDPFCGTGVILQEAALMNYATYGTDFDKKMVEYSQENISWLYDKVDKNIYGFVNSFETADATSFKWTNQFDTIASEVYLGRPLSTQPNPETINLIIQDTNTILKKFLTNLASQTEKGFEFCLALPAWKNKNSFKHLPLLDHLKELGYTRMSFVHVSNKDLIYYREGQIVARELVKLIRN